jgi:hypothetical protein
MCLRITCLLSCSTRIATAQGARSTDGQAFVTDSFARFVFPLDKRQSYTRDVPIKGAYPGSPEYSWELGWDRAHYVDGRDPLGLWLVTRWKPGGPRKGTLADLIRGYTLDPMINCTTCDGAVYVDQRRDTNTVFASVERGRLVFNVRGREAVHRIFPALPETVTFSRSVRHIPQQEYGPVDSTEVQTVVVNCNLTGSGQSRRSCVVPPPVPPKAPPDADSAAAENAPRRVHVPVIRFANATLAKHVKVRVKKSFGTIWKVLSTGPNGFVRLDQAPVGPLLLEALCPSGGSKRTTISGTAFVQVVPRQDTSVQLWTDPTVCSR